VSGEAGLAEIADLEHWDDRRKRWILYRDPQLHKLDCERYPFDALPVRIFLDTSVINLLIKHAGTIFDMADLDASLPLARRREIEALLHVFAVGARADWSLIASSRTQGEVSKTADQVLRQDLVEYVLQLVERDTSDSAYGDDLGRRLADASLFEALPDSADPELLGNAIGLRCDAFVTVDVRTIISRRERLPQIPLRILTPIEWWSHVKPWAGLWA
jgi:hypothetical protein